MRREQNDLAVQRLPQRIYAPFVEHIFKKHNIRIYDSQQGKTQRIDRFPKFIREESRKLNLGIESIVGSVKFTGYVDYESDEVVRLNSDHNLTKLAMYLTKREVDQQATNRYSVSYPTSELLSVGVYSSIINDGTGEELRKEIIFLAERENGEVIELDSYWLYQRFTGSVMTFDEKVYPSIQVKAVKKTIELRKLIKNKREQQLDKVSGYLQRTFKKQIDEIIDKRQQYELENVENKNSVLINQMNANLIDTEVRRDERLMLVERQRNIGMEPPKLLMQLELSPNGQMSRLVSTDFKEIVEQYEKENGRSNFKVYKPFAIVDFYSERFNGEPRFIIVTNLQHYSLSEDHIEDLGDILDKVYIYVVENCGVIAERAMAEEVFTFKQY